VSRPSARATVTRRPSTIAGRYKYAVEKDLLDHCPAVHVRRPWIDHEFHTAGLDQNEAGALLVAAGLSAAVRALISLLALNELRVPQLMAGRVLQARPLAGAPTKNLV
jgi:hypothetical protein